MLAAILVVVPFVGTWIEIINWYPIIDKSLSYPSWVRGLKSMVIPKQKGIILSYPSWVRGLKYNIIICVIQLVSRRTLRGYVD